MRWWRTTGIVLLAVLTAGAMALVAGVASSRIQSSEEQAAIQPFYDVPSPLPGPAGTVIRTEPLGVEVPGATALRMLYVSERPDGTPAASGGMLFIPDAPAPPEGRPVVAWAHGTLGLGDACAPSRSANPLADTDNWLDQMMQLGWVVAATDYVGVGTPDQSLYLIAQSEVRDLVNAVRAARNVPEAQAGTRYATWGHSQGGHSSVWTGHLGERYAPELDLLGVAAAAPALELGDIIGAQWTTLVGWVIGSDVVESWPQYYPDLPVSEVLTPIGEDIDARLASDCIQEASQDALVRKTLGQEFFSADPTSVPAWADAAADQTPPPLPADMPAFIAQGTADTVVLPWPNAIVQVEWCAAGSSLSMLWMGGVNHVPAATTAGPSAVAWLNDRFAGRPAPRTCDTPPPVAVQVPTASTS